MFKLFEKLYDKKIDSIGLAFFRIAYFAVLFGELGQIHYFKNLIFDPIPFIQPCEIDLGIALSAWMVCCLLLMVGLFTKTMVWLNYAFTLVFLSTISSFEYHVFYTYTSVNLLCLFLPISQQLSIDRLLEKLKYSNTEYLYQPPTTTTVLSYTMPIFITIGFVYLDSIFYKTISTFWMQGLGVWLPSSFPQMSITSTNGLGGFLINQELLTKFFGYLTLIFEAIFIFLFWFKKFRLPFFIIGIGLHLGILISFPIPWFALTVVATYLLLLPVGYYRKLGQYLFKKRKTLWTLFYDEKCPLSLRKKIILEHFDIFQFIDFKSMKTEQQVHESDAVLTANTLIENNCVKQPVVLPPNIDELKIFNYLTFKEIRIKAITIGILLLCGIQILISYNSGLPQKLRKDSGISANAISKGMGQLSKNSNFYGKRFAGLTHHPVFMDEHFHAYNHIIAISYQPPTGAEIWLPIIDKTGSPDWYIYGFNWVKWTFRVNSSGKIPYEQFSEGVKRFTAFWAYKNGKKTMDAQFKLHLKKIDVPKKFEANFLEQQRAKSWVDMGSITWKNNTFSLEIQDAYTSLFKLPK